MTVLLVVGLGNPGPAYAGHRHNVGHQVLDAVAREIAGTFGSHRKARARVLEGRFGPGGVGGPRVVLAKPLTFMNVSGGPVASLASFYGAEPDHILVVHDELDLPPATLRLKRGGGEGGHNGLKSISSALGTKDYLRLRIGIGRPPGRMDPADYVLRDFARAERDELAVTIAEAVEAVEDVATLGFTAAQERLHSRT
ncbi:MULTISPECIES: aminoacyl-tRNA hydrolase [unclassified Pseudactinotalea]|uniref:aminoacyl-tRNA hydrolase n=1 Tax=unclassified Pseudactinotalea TaxID=2649176 RepID=UPI00128D5101|nr:MULTISPECIES: aminoacyl-tRNA hydrolase [unclassified Pseudactinotalea]MPV48695.1 aminoacyl-tRNA hydrolase [Pseudactinotalea sp. HY160]QGH68661.1 aminoacyl-tRNA hydrolase [Pseudactinotalea sp. HY158]